MFYYHFFPTLMGILLIIPSLVITFLSFSGLGLIFSSLNVKYRDVRYALPFFLQLLIFLTPVIYPASILGKHQWLMYINPMGGVIETMRVGLLGVGTINWLVFGSSALFSVIEVNAMLSQINLLVTGKKYEEALKELDKISKLKLEDNTKVMVQSMKISCTIALGDLKKALKITNDLKKSSEQLAHFHMAQIEAKQGNLEKALDYVRGKGFPCKSELGGSPAISALAGYYLGQGSADLPEVYFCGAKPASVTEFLEKEAADLGELFKYSAENKAKPRTLGLEVDKFKLMLSCKSGRSLNDLMSKSPKQREFETDLAGLKKQIKSKNCIPEEVMHQLESLVQKYSSRSGAAIKDFCQKLNSKSEGWNKLIQWDYEQLSGMEAGISSVQDRNKELRKWYREMDTGSDQALQNIEKTIGEYQKPINFADYIASLKKVIDERILGKNGSIDEIILGPTNENGTAVIALGGLNKGTPQECQALINSIQGLREDYKNKGVEVKLFVGTNAFKGDPAEIKAYWESIKQADILSFNEAELNSIYNALYSSDASIPLGEKFRILGASGFNGIMVCHSAEGAIIGAFGKLDQKMEGKLTQFADYLKESLQLAVDGTSLVYENGVHPHDSNVRNYSHNVRKRQEGSFYVEFVHPHKQLANGIEGVNSVQIDHPLGNLVGLGANFDGILLSYLFRRD